MYLLSRVTVQNLIFHYDEGLVTEDNGLRHIPIHDVEICLNMFKVKRMHLPDICLKRDVKVRDRGATA